MLFLIPLNTRLGRAIDNHDHEDVPGLDVLGIDFLLFDHDAILSLLFPEVHGEQEGFR